MGTQYTQSSRKSVAPRNFDWSLERRRRERRKRSELQSDEAGMQCVNFFKQEWRSLQRKEASGCARE
jgi:hypothetical protein